MPTEGQNVRNASSPGPMGLGFGSPMPIFARPMMREERTGAAGEQDRAASQPATAVLELSPGRRDRHARLPHPTLPLGRRHPRRRSSRIVVTVPITSSRSSSGVSFAPSRSIRNALSRNAACFVARTASPLPFALIR